MCRSSLWTSLPALVPWEHCMGQGMKLGVSIPKMNAFGESWSGWANTEPCQAGSLLSVFTHAAGTFKSSQAVLSPASPGKLKREVEKNQGTPRGENGVRGQQHAEEWAGICRPSQISAVINSLHSEPHF